MVYGISGDGEGELVVFAHDGDASRSRTTATTEPRELLLLAGEPLQRAGRPLRPVRDDDQGRSSARPIDDFQAGRFGAIAR